MDAFLPLFPLQLVAFPGETVNLHIFEPRYIQLVKDCVEKDMEFGIPVYQEGKKLSLGTALKITAIVKTYAGGKMDISTKATRTFKLDSFFEIYPSKLYPGGEVSFFDWNGKTDILFSRRIIELARRLYKVMNITNVQLLDENEFACFQIAHKVGFNKEQELHFLTITKEEDRQVYMINHLEQFLPAVEEMEALRKKAELNGHFKYIIPPTV